MKKLFLLIASGSIVFAAGAQERTMHAPMRMDYDFSKYKATMKALINRKSSTTASKTTAAPRWYSYVNYFDQNESASSSSIDYATPYLWGGNNAYMAFSDGAGGTTFDTANLVSYSLVMDPAFTTPTTDGFNDWDYYPGDMKITSTNSYQIDSINFTGFYLTNPAKIGATANVKDTLRVSIVHGNGGATSDIYETATTITAGLLANYGTVGSILKNQRMDHNGARLIADGSTVQTRDIILDNTTTPPSWAADTADGVYVGKVGFATPINIAAGEMVGVTVSFISGDPAFTPFDTVFFGSPTVPPAKYNMFRPAVAYKGSGTTVTFATYNASDRNTGGFVDETTTGIYVPLWFWSAGSGAATVQYPEILVHAICASCGVVEEPTTGIKNTANIRETAAYPNPASGELNVPFKLAGKADVTVTLTNMLGQVVAVNNMGTVSSGIAVFNTNTLSNGLYTYTVIADGQRTTGRVAVAH